jgi:hypothetical protein
MESGNPVITGAQQELIEKHAAILGEDGKGIIQDIEEDAGKTGKLPADVFKSIDSCLQSIGQRAKRQERSNEEIQEREPERLLQVEAIREHATRLTGARAGGDDTIVEGVRQAMLVLVGNFKEAVDRDKEDGLDPDTARAWKDQVHEIAVQAKLDLPTDGSSGGGTGPPAPTEATDRLALLKSAIKLANHTMDAVAREIQDPDETTLRGFGKHLGTLKKEIMALSRSLMVNQSAGVAMEATRLAGEAGDAIKSSRELIRAALRGLGVASDISEASGPTRTQRPPPARPVMGSIDPDWTSRDTRPVAPGWPPVHTPAATAWPPADSIPKPRMKGAGGELSTLMRGMMNAQANDSGWPTFSGKYVEYPRFRKEWWAYRQTYHGHVRIELVCCSLKERSLASNVRLLVNDVDDLREAWNTLDTCFDWPEKYISEALDPVVKFRSYKAFDNGAIRKFYSILRAAMIGARKARLLSRLINDQTMPSILARMPPTDWHQWAKERAAWMREAIEEAFWNFVDQKWRDALNVAAAEPPVWGAGGRGRPTPQDGKKEAAKLAKAGAAAVHVTGVDEKRLCQGDSGRTCVFKDVMGCPGMHPPWLCKVLGGLPAGEREKLIKDNRLCPFCLLHDKDKPCGAKQKPVAYTAPKCKRKHIQKLHDFLKDLFREESQVHMVHGDDGWEESEEAWDLGGEEEMIVGTVQQEDDCSWQDACKPWTEQDEGAGDGVYQVGTCQGAPGAEAGAVEQPSAGQCKEAEAARADEKASEMDDLILEGEEQEYFLEPLMRKASPERPRRGQAASNKSSPKEKVAVTEGKERKRGKKKEKKALKRGEAGRKARGQGQRAQLATGRNKQPPTSSTIRRPRAEGWVPTSMKRRKK